jgi:hypothetical protein
MKRPVFRNILSSLYGNHCRDFSSVTRSRLELADIPVGFAV